MSEHSRREGYWQYYELAKEVEAPSLKRELIEIIRENPCPRRENGNRGRPPVHSKEKLDFACLLMMGRQQHLSRSRIGPARHADTMGQRARPGPYHTGQAPPDDTGGLARSDRGRDGPPLHQRGGRGDGARWEPTAARRRPLGTNTSRGQAGRSATSSRHAKRPTGNTT